MSKNQFERIYSRIKHHLEYKRNTRPHDNISPKAKFAMVLEYLASGSNQRHMASIYRVGPNTFGKMIDKVCDAICAEFQEEAFKTYTNSDWLNVSNQFNAVWNLPNCIGAIDGKHIEIKCPPNAGSVNYNYKVRTYCIFNYRSKVNSENTHVNILSSISIVSC